MPADARPPRSAGITVLATIAIAAALYFGRDIFIPVALAILFTALLRPLVRWLERIGLSAPVGATVVLVALVGVLAVAVLSLSDPVRQWVGQAPRTLEAAEQRLRQLRRPLQGLTIAAQKMESVATDPAGQGPHPGAAGPAAAPAVPTPQANMPGVAARVFGTTTAILGGLVEVVLLMFLLLASGNTFLGKLVKVMPGRKDKREAVEIVQETESVVSHYMVVTALINAGQGALVGVAMALIHLPNPVLWGILTFFLEFVPYLGGASMLILLTLAGLATFDRVGHALLAPLIYLAITTLQNNLVSPLAYGHRLKLNPVAVFVGVLFWYYMWGVPGAFLAVPIIATVKILGDHLEGLAPVSEFLGD
jgi:predicted PurR-regulated permease PerM